MSMEFNFKKKICIIDVYATTENKFNMLRNCIKSLAPLGVDIMIVAHCLIPEDIIKSVTYYLYDKTNEFNKNNVYGWRVVNGIEVRNQVNKSHEYPIISAMRLAFNSAKALKYDFFYFTEFDVDYSANGINQLRDLENRIISENKDFAFLYPEEAMWGDIRGKYYETIIFAGKLSPFLDKFESYFPDNLNEYNEKFASRFPNCLEHFFWDCFKNSSHIRIDKYATQYFNDSNINVSSYRNTRCEILLDPSDDPYLVINNNDNFSYSLEVKIGTELISSFIPGSDFMVFRIPHDCEIEISLHDNQILHLRKNLTYDSQKKEEYKKEGAVIFHDPLRKIAIDKKIMFPKKSFITFVNEKYVPLVDRLAETISLFSKYPLIVYSYNFDYIPKQNNIFTKRLDNSDLKTPEFDKTSGLSDDVGIVDRADYDAYYTLSRKPTVLVDAIKNGLEEGIFLDADGIVNRNIDDVFDWSSDCTDYPLVGKGLFEYMMLYGKGDPAKGPPLEQPIMDLLDIKQRTVFYGQTNVILFNKNCKDFFEECVRISNSDPILKNNLLYCPFQDETIINAVLWKRGATKQLPLVHFNLTNYTELKKFNSSKSGMYLNDSAWHWVPENKNDIKYFHGCKSPTEIDKCIAYLKGDRSDEVLPTIIKNKTESAGKKIAIVTLFDKNYEKVAEISIPNKIKYARKHGYDLIYFDKSIDLSRPPQWSKVKAIEYALKDYDWVWWIDIDALIMEFDIKLESIIDDNYDIIFTGNKFSYLSNGSSFFKNTDISSKFLKDCYELTLPCLKDVNVHVFDHEQQSMRALLLHDEVYKQKTKIIDERVCNSYCTTNNQSVLGAYPNWNNEPNIYQKGDFVIQFCGRNFEERLQDMLHYSLPKHISVVLFANEPSLIAQQLNNIATNSRFNIEVFLPKAVHSNFHSFSQMVNYSIDETSHEYMIFINPKTIVDSSDIEKIIKLLNSGYCFVSLVGFGLFGATKQLFREIGTFDERFIGGEYEDNDFALRLKLFGKAIYAHYDHGKYNHTQSKSKYNPIRGSASSKFYDKWNFIESENKYYISKNDYLSISKISQRHIKDNDVKHSWNDYSKSDISESYGIFNTTKNCGIEIVDKNKYKKIANASVKIVYNNNMEFYISCQSDPLHHNPISMYLVNADDYNVHHAEHEFILNAGTWWGNSLDKNKKYEIRLFHDGNLIYKTLLINPIDILLNFNLMLNLYEK